MDDLDVEPHGDDGLWSEALWGAGLLGTVIAVVALIAAFGP
jgi:hypothetical protein